MFLVQQEKTNLQKILS